MPRTRSIPVTAAEPITLPTDIILAMHEKRLAREYKVVTLDMSTARDFAAATEKKITFRGNFVGLIYISSVGTPLKLSMNTADSDAIPLYTAGGVTLAYDEVFVTHDAAAGVTAVLLLGWDLRT